MSLDNSRIHTLELAVDNLLAVVCPRLAEAIVAQELAIHNMSDTVADVVEELKTLSGSPSRRLNGQPQLQRTCSSDYVLRKRSLDELVNALIAKVSAHGVVIEQMQTFMSGPMGSPGSGPGPVGVPSGGSTYRTVNTGDTWFGNPS